MTVQQTYSHDLVIRRLVGDDSAALQRLAELESSEVPAGELLGAFLGDSLIAAVGAAGEATLADPFVPSAGAVELLRLRAEQMQGRRARRRRLGGFRRGGRRSARGALAGSPPGGGGRLLQL